MADLLEIKPTIRLCVSCLFCQSDKVDIKELIFQGMHVLADCQCQLCEQQFYHTLPVGHDRLFPLSFDEAGNSMVLSTRPAEWLVKPLMNSFFTHPKEAALIEKKVFIRKEHAIILNCLDTCFGHVFTKLWSVPALLNAFPDKSLIVLLPRKMEWLVPEGVGEIWTVDLPLNKLALQLSALDSFVKQEMTRYGKVYLSPAYPHIDTEKLPMEALLKQQRFDLKQFGALPPQISFILRDDRFWHGSGFEYFLYKVCIKLGILRYFRWYFVWRQNRFVNKIAGKIKHELKDVALLAMGIGKKGGLASCINDIRTQQPSCAVEEEWCSLYAKSHVVIGVHGSNMLIPTALSAGFIEILPRHKIPHITEDLVLQHGSRYSVFLGRHVDHYASATLVSMHAVSMIRDFPFLYENTEQNPGQEKQGCREKKYLS